MTSGATKPRTALGCDYSTTKVHLAKVDRDSVLKVLPVDLKGKTLSERVTALTLALDELSPCPVMLIEDGFIHLREGEALASGEARTPNYRAPLQLAEMRSMVATLAVLAGMQVYVLPAASWRSLAGVKVPGVRHAGRKDLKRAAIDLVRLQFGYETRDDNAAEAVCMATAGLGLWAQHEASRVRR